MMKLIKTNDGLIGMKTKDKIVWADSREHLDRIVFHHYAYNHGYTLADAEEEVSFALDAMAQSNHTLAEFGVLGSFIYSTTEQDPDEAHF